MASVREYYEAATRELAAPFAVVDMAAFRDNAADIRRRAAGTPVRVVSKSIRCRHLLREALAMPGFAGVMAFTLPEALWLAAGGPEGPVSDDILVAYPTADSRALAELAADPAAAERITVMVDDTAHLDMIAAAAPDPRHPVKVCIDVDTSWQPLGARTRIGA
ncbi:alanine racemase, partial [Streptomonospora algeriensis]